MKLQPTSTIHFLILPWYLPFAPVNNNAKTLNWLVMWLSKYMAVVKSVCLMGLFKKFVVTWKNLFCPYSITIPSEYSGVTVSCPVSCDRIHSISGCWLEHWAVVYAILWVQSGLVNQKQHSVESRKDLCLSRQQRQQRQQRIYMPWEYQ